MIIQFIETTAHTIHLDADLADVIADVDPLTDMWCEVDHARQTGMWAGIDTLPTVSP